MAVDVTYRSWVVAGNGMVKLPVLDAKPAARNVRPSPYEVSSPGSVVVLSASNNSTWQLPQVCPATEVAVAADNTGKLIRGSLA